MVHKVISFNTAAAIGKIHKFCRKTYTDCKDYGLELWLNSTLRNACVYKRWCGTDLVYKTAVVALDPILYIFI